MLTFGLVLSLLCATTHAFTFELAAGSTKCFFEELALDARFRGKWDSPPAYSQFLDLVVYDPANYVIQRDRSLDKGVIDFFATTNGYYKLCFVSRVAAGAADAAALTPRNISLDVHGVAGDAGDVVDFQELARREHLQPTEMNLRLIDQNIHASHQEMHRLREHEATLEGHLEYTLLLVRVVPTVLLLFAPLCGLSAAMIMKRFLRRHQVLE
eukprot:TRINITY_DN59840_c0_g1_i1.p1 TRINITY_DN59840_c0_g1~~TRINITY_DN59840_c0_g1_i1.p1  ORF type:complete len:212 (-),score=37.62 TRINITY_DN59840_c0_g1_i1:294-929(-)